MIILNIERFSEKSSAYHDLDKFINWCKTFVLSLTIRKYKIMTFHRTEEMVKSD